MNCPECHNHMADLGNDLYMCQCGLRMEQLSIFATEHERCSECKRPLKSKVARQEGIGAVCKKKRGATDATR